MKSVFTKTAHGIIPNNDESLELFCKIPDGAFVCVEYIKKRNYENHKRWFAMAKVCFDMQEQFDNSEIFRKHLLMIAGYFDMIIIPVPARLQKVLNYLRKYLDGDMADAIIDIIEQSFGVQYIPKSMAFDKMDEIEFQSMFDKAINGFISRYGNGLTEDELLKIIAFD